MSDREYAASLLYDERRDWGRDVHRDPQPVVDQYRPWDRSGTPELPIGAAKAARGVEL